jgi:hypothetical protein
LASSVGAGRIVHVGNRRSRILRDLAAGLQTPRQRRSILSLRLIRTPWGDRGEAVHLSARNSPSVQPGVEFVQQTPDVVAIELAQEHIDLLVFADVESAWQVREGYEHLTPLLADGAVLAFWDWQANHGLCIERFLGAILPSDVRFKGLLASDDLLLLQRVPVAPTA